MQFMDQFLRYPDIKQKQKNINVKKFGIGLKIGTDLHKLII